MNWAQRSFKHNVAFAAGVARGEIRFVHSTAVSVVHIFKAIGEAIYLDTRESIDTLSGNQQDYQHTSARLSAQGRAMIAPIKKAMALFELLSQDQTTRDILINFAAQYYQSDTPIMLSEQAGELVGGFIPAIIIAAITGNPELVSAEIAGEAGADITGVATEANDIAKTLQELQQTKTIEQTEVDQLHKLAERPEGVDEGAVYHADIENLPYPGYETENNLEHPAGQQYNLKSKEAKNFAGKPVPFVFQRGSSFAREADFIGAGVSGRYMHLSSNTRTSKALWRSSYAVKGRWNKDGYIVRIVLGHELPGWRGIAASQSLAEEGFPDWILSGGGEQVYIPMVNPLLDLNTHQVLLRTAKITGDNGVLLFFAKANNVSLLAQC